VKFAGSGAALKEIGKDKEQDVNFLTWPVRSDAGFPGNRR
jgi:hypothetical protein